MRLGKYTLEHRNLGQAEGAHKVGASERTSRKTTETLAFRVESEAKRSAYRYSSIFLKLFLSSAATSSMR